MHLDGSPGAGHLLAAAGDRGLPGEPPRSGRREVDDLLWGGGHTQDDRGAGSGLHHLQLGHGGCCLNAASLHLEASQTAARQKICSFKAISSSMVGLRFGLDIHASNEHSEPGERSAVWMEKVEELAGRGLSIRQLLDFYSELGSGLMPHFDPDRSTTHDVVRQAIIPSSLKLRTGVLPSVC